MKNVLVMIVLRLNKLSLDLNLETSEMESGITELRKNTVRSY